MLVAVIVNFALFTLVDWLYRAWRRRKMNENIRRLLEMMPLDEWPEHSGELCPICGSTLKEDPLGGVYLVCPNCGWSGW
ncbi:MAG: hypothetical protein DRJ38_00360 [Thermoprotei archaeon]|nr:MAG: hypothetical protein DRJ38_00360 [Thermoprotei archaeon]